MKKIYNVLRAIVIGVLFANTSCSEDCEHLMLEGNDAFITSCSASAGFGSCDGVIVGDSILISIPNDANIASMKVKMTVSENATITPLVDTIREWREPIHFTVTSANKTIRKEYVVVVQEMVSETVYEGCLRFGSQKEIDGFGENQYTKVGGIVLYNGSSADPITDLSPLSSIREINGGLSIQGLGMRTVIFSHLEKVGRFMMQSPLATKVRFPMLKFVGGEFQIGENASGAMPIVHAEMDEVSLPSLEYVGGNFILYSCDRIKTLESLSNLSYVGGEFAVIGGCFKTLKGLEKLTKINSNYTVRGDLETLEGFAVESVRGDFLLDIEYLTTLDGLKTLKKLDGSFELKRSRFLKNLKGLEHIQAKKIALSDFLVLESLEGLSVQAEMERLLFSGFYALNDISALSVLKRVDTDILFQGMLELESLHGLENLEYVGGQCRLETMPKLTDMSALGNLAFAGELYFTQMNVLEQLPVLSRLTETKSLYFANLLALKNLDGLESMTKITKGRLVILACKELTDVSGLQNMAEVKFYQQSDKIWIENNTKLASFCPILDLVKKYMNLSGKMTILKNYYNPTKADINAGKCEGVGGNGITGGKG